MWAEPQGILKPEARPHGCAADRRWRSRSCCFPLPRVHGKGGRVHADTHAETALDVSSSGSTMMRCDIPRPPCFHRSSRGLGLRYGARLLRSAAWMVAPNWMSAPQR